MDKEQLERLKELAQKATKEPWDFAQKYDEWENYIGPKNWVPAGKWIAVFWYSRDADFVKEANPLAILELIADYERLQKEYAELHAISSDTDILNDPQALLTTYFAGRMAEGREKNREIDQLTRKVERLEKEADWLAFELQALSPDKKFQTDKYWRAFAHKAVEESDQ